MKHFEVDNFTFDTLLAVLQKGMELQNDIEEFLKPYGISHGRFSILLTLYADMERPMHPSEIAEKLKRSRPTVSGMMKKLLLDGLIIESSEGSDGRKKCVSLSPKAYSLLKEIILPYNIRIMELGSRLDDNEKKQLQELIRKIKI